MKNKRRPQRQPQPKTYVVMSGCGLYPHGRAFVQIVAPELDTTMSVHEARDLAAVISRAAEAAEMEGMFMQFMVEKIGAKPEQVAQLLVEWRGLRDALWVEHYGRANAPISADEWGPNWEKGKGDE
jgi:hypothetical protein